MHPWVVVCLVFSSLVCAREDCPNGERCEEAHTCCYSRAMGYDCCPFHQAECCADHVHCCPEGSLCDADASSCVNATASVPWMEGTPAVPPVLSKSFRMVRSYDPEDDSSICPDESGCPAEYSCLSLSVLAGFGCCPFAQGILCGDGKHCCPDGQQCNADSRSCIRKEFVNAVICGDGESECPEKTTCCEDSDRSWGCCPLPEAVCCEDTAHGCPGGSACDVKQSKCVSLSTSQEMPIGWGCCPLPEAVCCADFKHCCPHGKKCNLKARTCDSGSSSIPWAETSAAVPRRSAAEGGATCDSTHSCPEGSICCRNPLGGWACCPPPAEVAEGGLIDCENNITCSNHSTCPDHTTCCLMSVSKMWGCCPIPEAVCCFDGMHCCPKHYLCDESRGTCYKGEVAIPWYTKAPALDGGGENRCAPHFTFCQLSSGQWGCCPLYESPPDRSQEKVFSCQEGAFFCTEGQTCCCLSSDTCACCPTSNAVCCGDMRHCCPAGHTCAEGGTCTRNVALRWNLYHIFFSRPEKRAKTL
ncbi:hypothetical protein NHX12_032450 [Muraenolepis orangiensis]|uniref:Granulins domain-containing protein n=1 Tax=Muraenolepis orangiensis TaxID=630683 RepID=A0A9Q0II89_9TELE|nr:hypothetical protein NHX12_032450 [Muraenolepis orangiensis]